MVKYKFSPKGDWRSQHNDDGRIHDEETAGSEAR
jgi:hypothetical protein